MKKILLAFQFLTIVSVKDLGEVSEQEIGSTTAFFPIVGFFEGLLLVILAAAFLKVFSAEVTNVLLVLVMVLINGGLHLDGLADTFDAIASRGDKEMKLAIMKDSAIGPIGVIAIIMTLLMKYVLLNGVFFHSVLKVYYATIVLMPVLSRWTMVPVAYYSKPARQDGMGRMFIKHTKLRELLLATALAILASLLVCSFASNLVLFMFYLMFIIPMLYVFNFIAVWFSNRHFEGMTGDSFGAVYEIAVLLFLVIAVNK